jgi:predicted kinase
LRLTPDGLARALLVNGTCGAGKSTVGAAVVEVLGALGDAVAFVDMDAMGVSWPRPGDDRFNKAIATRNLVSVAANFVAAGVTSLVLAGVIRDETDMARYELALGMPVTVVRLVLPSDVIDERLRRRHGDADPDGLAWHRRHAPELDAVLDRSSVPMVTVANTRPAAEVARAVLVAAGWIPRPG